MLCDNLQFYRAMCDNNGMGQEEQRFQLEQIQRRLREAIRRSGLKKKEIAAAIGVSDKTVSAYLHKNVFPALDTFARLCHCLGVPADEILGLGE